MPLLRLGVRAIDSPQTHLWISKAGLSFSVWNERSRLETLELIGEQIAGLRSLALYLAARTVDTYRGFVRDSLVGVRSDVTSSSCSLSRISDCQWRHSNT